jgi:hypothetical protein
MADGKHCPRCGKDIGGWSIVFAVIPNRLRCPWCKGHIGYYGIWLDVIPVGLFIIACLAMLGLGVADLIDAPSGVVCAAILLAGAVPLEAVSVWYLRSRKDLVSWWPEGGG